MTDAATFGNGESIPLAVTATTQEQPPANELHPHTVVFGTDPKTQFKVTITPGAIQPAPPAYVPPAVVQTAAGPQLQWEGKRLVLNGWSTWCLPDHIAGVNGNAQALLANFANYCKIAAAAGCNSLRIRTLATDAFQGAGGPTGMSLAEYVAAASSLPTIAQANGIPWIWFCDWAPSDGPHPGSGWAGQASVTFPLWTAIMGEIGANAPGVLYEPFNEPHQLAVNDWVAAFQATIKFFRGQGHTGPLMINPLNWANEYDPAAIAELDDPQLLIVQHVYYEGQPWSRANYPVISQTAYPSIVTETGYYNNGTINAQFSQASAAALAVLPNSMPTYCGTSYFNGVWVDPNSILNAPMTAGNPGFTTWGRIVDASL